MGKSLFEDIEVPKAEITIDQIKISSKLIPIKYEDIVFSALTQLSCQNCGMWGRTYRCPPFSMKYDRTREYLKQFNNFVLIIAESDPNDYETRYKNMKEKCGHLGEYRIQNLVGTQIAAKNLGQSQTDLRTILKFLRSKYEKVQGYGSASCLKCHPCRKQLKQPCAYPQDSFSSPESSGIDLYKTLQNIGIKIESPPIKQYKAICFVCWR